jgi:hypothetical protein
MLGVLAAEGAVFAPLQTVGRVLFVLDRVVVSLLALIASERDFNSCASSHCFGTSYFIYPKSGALPPCVDKAERLAPPRFPAAFGKKARKKKPLV